LAADFTIIVAEKRLEIKRKSLDVDNEYFGECIANYAARVRKKRHKGK
jgi:hypothetical protein